MCLKIVRGASLLALLVLLCSWAVHAANSDALWQIVQQQCVPHWRQTQDAAPCAQVDISQGEGRGFVVLKDIRGVLQYLLIPTARISGIESPLLLRPDAPDFWAAAWDARRWMDRLHGSPLPREAVALTINSPHGRSQNQLHIHISCVLPVLAGQLRQLPPKPVWQALPGGLNGHAYQVRAVQSEDLRGVQPFRLLADGVAGARDEMGDYTMAIVATRFNQAPGFWLLASKADRLAGNVGAAEGDVQDHDCRVLQAAPVSP